MMPRWALLPYIESGELNELTISPRVSITQQANMGVYLLYQKQRYQIPKIKAAVDFLVERVKAGY